MERGGVGWGGGYTNRLLWGLGNKGEREQRDQKK